MSLVDEVSETVRDTWDSVWGMNIYLFFNLAVYAREKRKREKESMDKMMAKNK